MVAVFLSHLRAARAAFLEGHETVLVLEGDVRLDTDHLMGLALAAPQRGRTETNVFKRLLAALPSEWRVLQVGYTCTTEGKLGTLRSMRKAYDGGYAARPRSSCVPDSVLDGAFAYVLSRRGAMALMRRFWPRGRLLDALDDEVVVGKVVGGPTTTARPLLFDFRGATNVVADYALYSKPHVYVMTVPGVQPPKGYDSMVGSSDGIVDLARQMLARHFSDIPDLVEPKVMLPLPPDRAPASSSAYFYLPTEVLAEESPFGLMRCAEFGAATMVGMATEGCCQNNHAALEAAQQGTDVSDLCGLAFTGVWQYAVNCGLAGTAQMAKVEHLNKEAGNNISSFRWGHLAYRSALSPQIYHFTLDLQRDHIEVEAAAAAAAVPRGQEGVEAADGKCEARADALAESVIAATAAEALPEHLVARAFVADANSALYRPVLQLLSRLRCIHDVGGHLGRT